MSEITKVVTDVSHYNEIAKAIQECTVDHTINYKPSEMANGVRDSFATGHHQGHNEGYEKGFVDGKEVGWDDGYGAGYTNGEAQGLIDGNAQGRQEAHDEFWDVFQNNGEGVHPYYAFAYSKWNDINYNPQYPIKFTSKSLTNTFYSARITDTKVPIHIEGCTTANTFSWSSIITIKELIVDETTTFNNAGFPTSLTSITISGVIGNNISFADCSKLTPLSVDSIVDALKKLENDESAKTLTLHATVKGSMTDEQIAAIAEKGWTLA